MKKTLVALGILAVLAALVIVQRHRLMVYGLSLSGPPPLLDAAEEGPEVRWLDDYFAVQELDERTFAIIEPRYAQQNVSYLIVGSDRAVLFDAGPGLRDIRGVAESLTDCPITFIPSHFHYDHTGNEVAFENVAVVDLPGLRDRAPEDRLTLTWQEHLGAAEGIDAPTLEIDEWLAPGSSLSLGDRSLRVLYTPGHTDDSISLVDVDSGQIFSGDFLYAGPLFAFLPNSSLSDYVAGSDTMLSAATKQARIFGAHRMGPPGVPSLGRGDVEDLRSALLAIAQGNLEGEGAYPVTYRVNEKIELLAEPSWLR